MQPEDKDYNDYNDYTMIKISTVGATSHKVRSGFVLRSWKVKKYVPFIRISGLWLKRIGFDIGDKYEILQKENQLLLKVVAGDCDSNPKLA